MTKMMMSALVGAAILSACGGAGESDGETTPCEKANVTVGFEAGETTLEPGPRDLILETISANKAECPIAHVTIYLDESGDETARMRSNHVSTLLTVRADMPAETKVRAVEEAPSDDLAGKVRISMATE